LIKPNNISQAYTPWPVNTTLLISDLIPSLYMYADTMVADRVHFHSATF